MDRSHQTARCGNCNQELDPAVAGPCPRCGSTNRILGAVVFGNVGIGAKASGVAESREESEQKKPWLLVIIWILTVGIPVMGYFLGGLPGLAIGIVGGIAVYFLTPFAVKKVVKITREHW